jgi:hypothetical protein
MNSWLRFVCLLAGVASVAYPGCAQFNDPHTYDNSPIGVNQIELAYAYAHANSSIDTSLIITGASLALNQGSVDFTRYFGLAGCLAWVKAGVPLAGLAGSVAGTNVSGSVVGAGDSAYQIAMLLKGGPALTVQQFENYKPTTTLGVSFTVTAPTGLYRPDKILNLGADRWAFRPEVALSYPFGKSQQWQLDVYANADFYTDNTSYRGREILRQQPLPGVEGHISYAFNDSVWASLDTRYSARGVTSLNGVDQNDSQQNFTVGSEVSIALDKQNTLIFEFAKVAVHRNGPANTGFAVKYDYSWGKGYKVAGDKSPLHK